MKIAFRVPLYAHTRYVEARLPGFFVRVCGLFKVAEARVLERPLEAASADLYREYPFLAGLGCPS